MIRSEFSLRKSKDATDFSRMFVQCIAFQVNRYICYLRVSSFSILIKLDVNFLYASNHIFVRYTFSMSKAVMS